LRESQSNIKIRRSASHNNNISYSNRGKEDKQEEEEEEEEEEKKRKWKMKKKKKKQDKKMKKLIEATYASVSDDVSEASALTTTMKLATANVQVSVREKEDEEENEAYSWQRRFSLAEQNSMDSLSFVHRVTGCPFRGAVITPYSGIVVERSVDAPEYPGERVRTLLLSLRNTSSHYRIL